MGSTAAKPVREAPVRYVAKKISRLDKTPIEQQFKKPEFTAQGINTRVDDVNTEPLMYVETSKDGSGTELTDHHTPRWYLNTYMEMVDNMRTDNTVISGNLPVSWERDKFEPYSLVRGRIDDEDLKWVLSAEQRSKPVEELVQFTKLDRQTLQDILDTVELPRTQYRNYKGKLHKSIEDANEHMKARKGQLEQAREAEVLRRIGYTDEEMEQEEQYLTNRTRGMKTLDDLGASSREKKRQVRTAQTSEMEEMLEQRRIQQIEEGDMSFLSEEEMETIDNRPMQLQSKMNPLAVRSGSYKKIYAADIGKDDVNQTKFQWWLDRTRRVKRAVDTIHGVPIYNERLSANEEQTRKQMQEAAEFNFSVSQAQGAKGFTDPRGHFDQFYRIMKDNKDYYQTGVEVHEGDGAEHDVFRFTHTKDHSPKPAAKAFEDRHMHAEKLDTNIHNLEDAFDAHQSTKNAKDDDSKKKGE